LPTNKRAVIHIFVEQTIDLFRISGRTLLALAPYVIAGVAVGEVLRRASWKGVFRKSPSTTSALTILTATLLGMASPLCTYGTVPVVLQCLRKGYPLAPLITFLAISSLMNPQLFLITWGGIHLEMALVLVGAVLLLGLIGGLLLQRVPSAWAVNPSIGNQEDLHNRGRESSDGESFLSGFWKSLQFVGFYIVAGILLGTLVEVFVPRDWILMILGPDRFHSVLLASILGVPLYACGGGTVPLVRSLMQSGMSQGAALAFFIVGPATRITPLLALATVVRPLFIAAYLVFVFGFALVVGTLYH
jgi:uncharacterized membrane protein YraQ (UPF0718 family)